MVSIPVKPRGNKIIAEPIEKKEEKIGSLFIPGTVNVNLSYARIVAVTEDTEHTFKVGETIMYPSEGAGLGQMIKGKHYIWFQLGEIWGTWTEDLL